MKKIYLALTFFCAALFLIGCEGRLDIPKKGVIALENFYQTDDDAESALVSVYYNAGRFLSNTMGTEAGWNECPLLNPFEYASDDMFAAGENKADGVEGNQIAAFWYDDTNSVITGSYHCYYMIINTCNQLLDHFADAADSQIKRRCVAEARVMRAYIHLILATGWNNPPLIDHVLDADERPGNVESQAVLLQWIADECDKALGDLDERSGPADANGCVKVTRGFCQAVKGKALMFKGDYAGAKTALGQVIQSGKYALVPSDKMETLYHYSGRGNEESVFELNLKYDATVDGYYWRAQPNFKLLWGWRSSRIFLPNGAGSPLPPKDPGAGAILPPSSWRPSWRTTAMTPRAARPGSRATTRSSMKCRMPAMPITRPWPTKRRIARAAFSTRPESMATWAISCGSASTGPKTARRAPRSSGTWSSCATPRCS
jgi:hypothetical protein